MIVAAPGPGPFICDGATHMNDGMLPSISRHPPRFWNGQDPKPSLQTCAPLSHVCECQAVLGPAQKTIKVMNLGVQLSRSKNTPLHLISVRALS